MRTVADIVVDIINDCGLGVLGCDLYTGTVTDISCNCSKCDYCLKGCLTYIQQGKISSNGCSSTQTQEITIYCRTNTNVSQEVGYKKIVKIVNLLKNTKCKDGYAVSFEFDNDIEITKDKSNRIMYFSTIKCFTHKK